MGHGCLPHQYVVGGYQCTSEFHRAGVYGIFTGREEVDLTLTFFLDDLFLQVIDGLSMSPVE